MQKANVTGNSGLFMCVRLAEASSYSAARILNTRNLSPVVGAWPGQFHVDSKSKTVLQTVLASDNELQAKEAA